MVSSMIPFFPKSYDLQIASVFLTGKIPKSRKYYLSVLLRIAKESKGKIEVNILIKSSRVSGA